MPLEIGVILAPCFLWLKPKRAGSRCWTELGWRRASLKPLCHVLKTLGSETNHWLHTAAPKIQTLHLRALSRHHLNSSSSGPCPLSSAEEQFPNTQHHAVPSGLSLSHRAQRCCSAPCEKLQPPLGLPSVPLLCPEHTQGPEQLFIYVLLSRLFGTVSP